MPAIESALNDLRYAIRTFRSHPGFTITAAATLALAIGLNTTLFTVFSAIALRPWPVPDPDRVVAVFAMDRDGRTGGLSPEEYRYIASKAGSFSGLAAIRESQMRLQGDTEWVQSGCGYVSANYFRTLAVAMKLGRGFLEEEDSAAGPTPVAVLSHAAWQKRFGADPDVLGKTIKIEGVPFTIVGVAGSSFTGTGGQAIEVWAPLAAFGIEHEKAERPVPSTINVAGRLATGVTRAQADAELAVLDRRFRTSGGLPPGGLAARRTAAFYDPAATAELGPVFGLMSAATLLILLLACANVGNLLLARAAARGKEIALRLSLGAGRSRIVRQLVTESSVLAGAAGCIGLALAAWAPARLLAALGMNDGGIDLKPDGTVLAFTAGLCVLACLGFGLAPALHATRLSLFETLKNQRGGGAARIRLRSILLGTQVAASVVLLVSAGLLVRGVQNARIQDPGFAVKGVYAADVKFPAGTYDPARVRTLYDQIAGEFGDREVAISTVEPLAGGKMATSFAVSGGTAATQRMALVQEVTAAYFDVLGIPVVAGRGFDRSDARRPVAIINQSMAERHFAGGNPLGKAIRVGGESFDVIGVARDAFVNDLDRVEPTFYLPFSGKRPGHVLLHTDGSGAATRLRALVARLEPRGQVDIRPLSANLDKWLRPSRIGSVLAGALGALALALASVGMFGVFAYLARQRAHEIGTRMALGGRPDRSSATYSVPARVPSRQGSE